MYPSLTTTSFTMANQINGVKAFAKAQMSRSKNTDSD